MILIINDTEVQYTLETEKTLFDVLHCVEQEIKNIGGNILSILIDKKSIEYSKDLWDSIPIDTIHTIQIEADYKEITQIKQLQTILEYLDIIESASNNSNYPRGIELKEIEFIVENIDILCANYISKNKPLKQLLQHAFDKIGLNNSDTLVPDEEAKIIFTHIRTTISQKIIILLNPENRWIEVNNLMKNAMPAFFKIIEFIYSSQETMAINQLLTSIEIFTQWLNVLALPPDITSNETIKEEWKRYHKLYTKKLHEIFVELTEAIEVKDWITVGDLVEYEIGPKTYEYIAIIEKYYPNSKKL